MNENNYINELINLNQHVNYLLSKNESLESLEFFEFTMKFKDIYKLTDSLKKLGQEKVFPINENTSEIVFKLIENINKLVKKNLEDFTSSDNEDVFDFYKDIFNSFIPVTPEVKYNKLSFYKYYDIDNSNIDFVKNFLEHIYKFTNIRSFNDNVIVVLGSEILNSSVFFKKIFDGNRVLQLNYFDESILNQENKNQFINMLIKYLNFSLKTSENFSYDEMVTNLIKLCFFNNECFANFVIKNTDTYAISVKNENGFIPNGILKYDLKELSNRDIYDDNYNATNDYLRELKSLDKDEVKCYTEHLKLFGNYSNEVKIKKMYLSINDIYNHIENKDIFKEHTLSFKTGNNNNNNNICETNLYGLSILNDMFSNVKVYENNHIFDEFKYNNFYIESLLNNKHDYLYTSLFDKVLTHKNTNHSNLNKFFSDYLFKIIFRYSNNKDDLINEISNIDLNKKVNFFSFYKKAILNDYFYDDFLNKSSYFKNIKEQDGCFDFINFYLQHENSSILLKNNDISNDLYHFFKEIDYPFNKLLKEKLFGNLTILNNDYCFYNEALKLLNNEVKLKQFNLFDEEKLFSFLTWNVYSSCASINSERNNTYHQNENEIANILILNVIKMYMCDNFKEYKQNINKNLFLSMKKYNIDYESILYFLNENINKINLSNYLDKNNMIDSLNSMKKEVHECFNGKLIKSKLSL